MGDPRDTDSEHTHHQNAHGPKARRQNAHQEEPPPPGTNPGVLDRDKLDREKAEKAGGQ
jgi:hypothetical protein